MAIVVPIVLRTDLAYARIWRHFPRAKRPPEYPKSRVWQLEMGLHPDSPKIAARILNAYFPGGYEPKERRVSQIETRSPPTLKLLNPTINLPLIRDSRLGIFPEDEPEWKVIDDLPKAYDMLPQVQHALLPELVDRCGRGVLAVARDIAFDVGLGNFGDACSHMPFADAAARLANQKLGLFAENNFWLPGDGYGSGAFTDYGYTEAGNLVECKYYSVPD